MTTVTIPIGNGSTAHATVGNGGSMIQPDYGYEMRAAGMALAREARNAELWMRRAEELKRQRNAALNERDMALRALAERGCTAVPTAAALWSAMVARADDEGGMNMDHMLEVMRAAGLA